MLDARRSLKLQGIVLAVFALVLAGCSAKSGGGSSTGGGDKSPIRIGSTLALTGALAPTAIIHKVAGEQFVKELNEHGGLLGRPVEWVVRDDESSPEKSAA